MHCTGGGDLFGFKIETRNKGAKLLQLLDSKALVAEERQSAAVFDRVKNEVKELVGDIVEA